MITNWHSFFIGSEFRDTVKKTFFLYLTAKEVGALFGYFRERGMKQGTRKVSSDQVSLKNIDGFLLLLMLMSIAYTSTDIDRLR